MQIDSLGQCLEEGVRRAEWVTTRRPEEAALGILGHVTLVLCFSGDAFATLHPSILSASSSAPGRLYSQGSAFEQYPVYFA